MPSSSEKRRTRVVQTESLVTEFHHRRRSSSVSPQEERECVPAVVPLPHHPFPFRAEMKSVPLIQMILMVLLMPAEYASGKTFICCGTNGSGLVVRLMGERMDI